MISLRQNHDIFNKENIPPFVSINKASDANLGVKTTLKKKSNNYRKPLKDITNLIAESMNQSSYKSLVSPSFPRLQSASTAIKRILIDESSKFNFR